MTVPGLALRVERPSGVTVARGYTFTVGDAARCLIGIGSGLSLREASQAVRASTHRDALAAGGAGEVSRQNALAADYLDTFGTVIHQRLAPEAGAHILVLGSRRLDDSDGSGYGAGRPVGDVGVLPRSATVLVAAALDRPHSAYQILLAGLAADESEQAWADFFGRLPRTPAPRWVVGDSSSGVRSAVRTTWPDAIFYPCEAHLHAAAMWRAAADRLPLGDVARLIDDCFWSVAAWRRLGGALEPFERSLTRGWWLRTGAEATRMVRAARGHAGYPRESGDAECVADEIVRRIGRRRHTFRNSSRLDTIVGLMAIDIAGRATETRYVEILGEYLSAMDGRRSRPDWEVQHDLYGRPSSLSHLISGRRRRDEVPEYGSGDAPADMACARGSFDIHIAAARSRSAIRETGRRGNRSPAGDVTVRDVPHLLEEWDRERNGNLDPAVIAVSLPIKAHWVCSRGHRWEAWLEDRVRGLAPCRTCNHELADSFTSVAALCPELIGEWDAVSNGRKSPAHTRVTSEIPVTWKCERDAGHQTYRMSPAARIAHLRGAIPGCPACRRPLTRDSGRHRRGDLGGSG